MDTTNDKLSEFGIYIHEKQNGQLNGGFYKSTNGLHGDENANGILANREIIKEKYDSGEKLAKTKLYKRRWYILFIYCLLTLTQATLWNTWGPIADSSEKAFGWTDGVVALLGDLGPIAFLLVVFPISWIVDVKGLRWACVVTSFAIMLGSAVRCITDKSPYVKITTAIGQFLNGIGTPVSMGVPPVLSSVWFPPNQRTLSTAIATVANMAGIGLSFVIGPYMVPDDNHSANTSTGNVTFYNETQFENNSISIDHYISSKKRKQIMTLLYTECGWSVFIFILVVGYFPAKPKLPPSISASVKRLKFMDGCKNLFRNKVFWVIACSYGVSIGTLGAWPGVLDIVLKPHGISETEAGMIGFYSVFSGILLSLVIAKCSDMFPKRKKLFLLGLYGTSGIFGLWMNLLLSNILPNSIVSLHVATVIGASTLTATSPVYFEMACETTYPVAEGITNFVLTFVNNVVSVIFLAVQIIPDVGTSWEGWCLFGTVALCLPGLIFLRERTNRLNVDEQTGNHDSDYKTKNISTKF